MEKLKEHSFLAFLVSNWVDAAKELFKQKSAANKAEARRRRRRRRGGGRGAVGRRPGGQLKRTGAFGEWSSTTSQSEEKATKNCEPSVRTRREPWKNMVARRR